MGGKVRRGRRVKKGRAETDPIRRKGESDARGGERAAPCRTKGYGERSGEGREREVVGGLRRIPRAVGSDGGGGGVDPCRAI